MKNELTITGINIILEMVEEIIRDIGDKSFEEFEADNLLVRATCFTLIQIGDSLAVISKKLNDLYPEVPWEYAKDMPNFILHDFHHIHTHAVYNTASYDMPRLRDMLIQIKVDLMHQV